MTRQYRSPILALVGEGMSIPPAAIGPKEPPLGPNKDSRIGNGSVGQAHPKLSTAPMNSNPYNRRPLRAMYKYIAAEMELLPHNFELKSKANFTIARPRNVKMHTTFGKTYDKAASIGGLSASKDEASTVLRDLSPAGVASILNPLSVLLHQPDTNEECIQHISRYSAK
ncbi:hypothetical protein Cgig2_015170 [Carnegiea gigantea]|uniref:Uncharacterized protein n=1 Tax=Carnegiea gigantea TaxID=171969 RepID=A0A9Q1QMK5_9CARY|nr:hypothetical protein Cgig2_015170 [Carnegiea gigantea]